MRLDTMRLDSVSPRTWLLATLAGWALLAWLLALLGMGGHVSSLADDPALMQSLPKPQPSPPARLGPLAQYAENGARPVLRRPSPQAILAATRRRGRSHREHLRLCPHQRVDHARPAHGDRATH